METAPHFLDHRLVEQIKLLYNSYKKCITRAK